MTKISKTMRFFTKIQNISIYNFGSKIQNISKYKNTKIIFGPPSPEKLFLDRQAQKIHFWTAKPEKTFLDRQVRKIHFWTAKFEKNWTAKFEIFGNFIWKIPFTPGRPPTKFGITSSTSQKPSTTWRRPHSLKFGRPQLNLGNTYLNPGKFISIKYVCQ